MGLGFQVDLGLSWPFLLHHQVCWGLGFRVLGYRDPQNVLEHSLLPKSPRCLDFSQQHMFQNFEDGQQPANLPRCSCRARIVHLRVVRTGPVFPDKDHKRESNTASTHSVPPSMLTPAFVLLRAGGVESSCCLHTKLSCEHVGLNGSNSVYTPH